MVMWPRTHPVRPPGGAKIYFSNSIFSATVRDISEIFSGSCVPRSALLKFRGTWGTGVKFGGQAPQSKKFCFFILRKIRSIDFRLNVLNDRYCGPLWSLKFLKKFKNCNSRKVDSNFWGWGTFSSSTHWGAFVRHLTLADFGPMDPNKNGFCSGAIAPHLGEIWGLAGLHFGPLFLELRETDFGNFKSIASTYSLLSILRFFKKSDSRNSNKFRSKLEKNAKSQFLGVRKAKIF